MKKFFVVIAISVICIITGCSKNETSPKTIEGKITGVMISINTESKQTKASASIEDAEGETHETRVNPIYAEKVFRAVNSNFQFNEPTYVRIEKAIDGMYEIKETAVMSYDYGTPACYLFTSDKKIIGYYKK